MGISGGDGVNRREFVATAAAAVGGAAAFGESYVGDSGSSPSSLAAGMESPPVNRPNILFILSDEHRADCLGCYGNRELRTPHLDALAADGVRYDNTFCTYPVCTPSRYSLLSGLYVHEHGASSNHCTLRTEIQTFPRLLRDAGYQTAAVGKMHFTPTYLDVGFEKMFLAEQDGPGRWDDDYHRELRDLGLVDINDLEDQRKEYRDHARPEYWETLGALPSNLPARYHTTEWIADKAIATLEDWSPEANLLMVGFVKPHHPFDPPQEWAGAYDPQAITLPPGWTSAPSPHDLKLSRGYFPHESLTEDAVRRAVAYYYATIEHMDVQIGRMIDLLKRKGLCDNTLIIYASDHGEYMGFHHLLLKGSYMYDPLARVPLMIKYPGQPNARGVASGLVSLVDVPATILACAGINAPDMRGADLRAKTAGRDVVFAESRGANQRMARTTKRKLLLADPPFPSLLFDLEKDPLENTNVYEDPAYRDDRDNLERLLRDWRNPEPLPAAYLNENAAVIDQPNVPPKTDAYRDAVVAYYDQKMEAWQAQRES